MVIFLIRDLIQKDEVTLLMSCLVRAGAQALNLDLLHVDLASPTLVTFSCGYTSKSPGAIHQLLGLSPE